MGNFTFLGNLSLFAIIATIAKYWWDLRKEQAKRRIEIYEKLRAGFDERQEFSEIFHAIEDHAQAKPGTQQAKDAADALRKLDWWKKMRFASFVENIALYAKSGVFSYELANYEFGDHARKCWYASPFWEDLCDPDKKNYEEPLWAMYKEFIERIKPCNDRLTENPDREIAELRI